MKTKPECIDCSRNNFIKLMQQFGVDEKLSKKYLLEFDRFITGIDLEMTPPEIARQSHTFIRDALGNHDPYRKEKYEANRMALDMYDRLYTSVRLSDNSVFSALKLAIAGNIFDPVYNHGLDQNDIIEGAINRKLAIDNADILLDEIVKSEKILYILDNAGEIVMDKLLLGILEEEGIIKPEKMILAVRGRPIINDALREDADETGLSKKYKVITSGDNVPGTVLKTSSGEFNNHFAGADLIISKGQGNYETLNDVKGHNIFFMLIAKCPVVAADLNVNIGDMVCISAI
jgi:damage-control phosphatase, subfamily I